MTVLGLSHTTYVVIIVVLTLGNVSAHTWPFVNLCPQRGTFAMEPGCRVFCLCHRPGGAGRLLACPDGYRFNHEQERCTDDAKVCEDNKLCDSPVLLDKAEHLLLKDLKTECASTGMTYCANRWELIVCHPVWSHMLGVIECDPDGDGSHTCSLMTDNCERNLSSVWESANNIDAADLGTPAGEDCEIPGGSSVSPPTPTSPTDPCDENPPPPEASETDDETEDPCDMVDELPGAECKAMGSWCLPDVETIVTCGESKQVRQVRNCKKVFAKYDLKASCLPLVFGCAYWQLNPVADSWVQGKSEHSVDHQHEEFEGWFREHWCKTHGRRGVMCTPDGVSLAHCNEKLIVDSVFQCDSVVPKEILLGCQFCEPGTSFCVYRPRADIADRCGVPGPGDDHNAACGFFPRRERGILGISNSSVPFSTNGTTTSNKESATDKKVTLTERTNP